MSGGSWDYISFKVDEIAERLCRSRPDTSCYLLRRALGKQLLQVGKALHDIEWVDSCDNSDGDEREALEACFKEPAKQIEVRELLAELERLKVEVEKLR